MTVVRATDMAPEVQEWVRPGGTYRRLSRDVGRLAGAPFDAEMVTLPPGAVNWPYHAHARMWEFYVIVSGAGTVRSPEGETAVGPGDCVMHPPGEPHQMRNAGDADLVYWVIANDVPNETTIHAG